MTAPPAPEVWALPIADMAAMLARREVSAVELMTAHLARIERVEPVLRAFIALDPEAALRAAARADADRAAGRAAPFAGIPVGVKDVIDVAGLRTTQGAAWLPGGPADADALPAARLRAAGFVPLGKTNTPEFGFGARCGNALQGPTACPHAPDLSSGGSSGGSGAAVAAGMVAGAHGADFGGSVRLPAAFCGAVGLRPTPGRIADPARALAFDTMASHGAIARSAACAWTLVQAMAGPHADDPTSLLPEPEPPGAPEGLRLAVAPTLGEAPVSAEIAAGFARAVAGMAAHVSVEEAAPDCDGAGAAFATRRAALIWRALGPHLEAGAPLAPTAAWNARRGAQVTAADWLAAEAARSRIRRSFAALFRRFDVLVTPATAVAPFSNTLDEVREIDGRPLGSIIEYMQITSTVSLVGLPALSLPAWTLPSGLPMGVQLIAPAGAERRLVALAGLFEDRLGMVWRRPAALDR